MEEREILKSWLSFELEQLGLSNEMAGQYAIGSVGRMRATGSLPEKIEIRLSESVLLSIFVPDSIRRWVEGEDVPEEMQQAAVMKETVERLARLHAHVMTALKEGAVVPQSGVALITDNFKPAFIRPRAYGKEL